MWIICRTERRVILTLYLMYRICRHITKNRTVELCVTRVATLYIKLGLGRHKKAVISKKLKERHFLKGKGDP